MTAMHIPGLPVTSMASGSVPETFVSPSPVAPAMNQAAWGWCEIRLVADRVPSLHSGSTHKVYRRWRFAVVMCQGQPRAGTMVFSSAVDPALPAKGQTRYALQQLADQGAIGVGEAAAFSWAVTSRGTTDPFAVALERTHRELSAAGWRQEASIPTHFTKPAPDDHAGAEPALLGVDGAATRIAERDQAVIAVARPRRERMGLDEWETDGGASSSPPVTLVGRHPTALSAEHQQRMKR